MNIQIILKIILLIISAVLIFLVLMQHGKSKGLGSLGGGVETGYWKPGMSGENKLAKVTAICLAFFMAVSLLQLAV